MRERSNRRRRGQAESAEPSDCGVSTFPSGLHMTPISHRPLHPHQIHLSSSLRSALYIYSLNVNTNEDSMGMIRLSACSARRLAPSTPLRTATRAAVRAGVTAGVRGIRTAAPFPTSTARAGVPKYARGVSHQPKTSAENPVSVLSLVWFGKL